MSLNTAASEWVGARGEKWGAQLSAMEFMLAPIDDPLLRALEIGAPSRIAEIGCGGGGTALELLRRAPAGSVVHGFDISQRLVDLARGRARPDDHHIVFEVADVATAVPHRPYAHLVSRLGVMFFDDPPAAFQNLFRWLEPGGRFTFAVWGRPSENPWITTVRDVVARIVEVPRSDPEAPGLFRYAEADRLLALLQQAGFRDLEVRDWHGALPIGGRLSPVEAAHFALSSFSSFGELLAGAGEGALDGARRSLTACFSRHHHDGAVRLGACVHIVTGATP